MLIVTSKPQRPACRAHCEIWVYACACECVCACGLYSVAVVSPEPVHNTRTHINTHHHQDPFRCLTLHACAFVARFLSLAELIIAVVRRPRVRGIVCIHIYMHAYACGGWRSHSQIRNICIRIFHASLQQSKYISAVRMRIQTFCVLRSDARSMLAQVHRAFRCDRQICLRNIYYESLVWVRFLN